MEGLRKDVVTTDGGPPFLTRVVVAEAANTTVQGGRVAPGVAVHSPTEPGRRANVRSNVERRLAPSVLGQVEARPFFPERPPTAAARDLPIVAVTAVGKAVETPGTVTQVRRPDRPTVADERGRDETKKANEVLPVAIPVLRPETKGGLEVEGDIEGEVVAQDRRDRVLGKADQGAHTDIGRPAVGVPGLRRLEVEQAPPRRVAVDRATSDLEIDDPGHDETKRPIAFRQKRVHRPFSVLDRGVDVVQGTPPPDPVQTPVTPAPPEARRQGVREGGEPATQRPDEGRVDAARRPPVVGHDVGQVTLLDLAGRVCVALGTPTPRPRRPREVPHTPPVVVVGQGHKVEDSSP